jgi:hypothetical protein
VCRPDLSELFFSLVSVLKTFSSSAALAFLSFLVLHAAIDATPPECSVRTFALKNEELRSSSLRRSASIEREKQQDL